MYIHTHTLTDIKSMIDQHRLGSDLANQTLQSFDFPDGWTDDGVCAFLKSNRSLSFTPAAAAIMPGRPRRARGSKSSGVSQDLAESRATTTGPMLSRRARIRAATLATAWQCLSERPVGWLHDPIQLPIISFNVRVFRICISSTALLQRSHVRTVRKPGC